MRNVALLQLKNNPNYQKNLDKILEYLSSLEENTIVVAPEVCLTDYDYENLQEACEFSEYALEQLLKCVNNQVLVLTLLRKVDNSYINQAVVIHKNKIIHKQAKHKLFKLGDEHKYLKAGVDSEIVKFKIDNLQYGLLICFELRYKELWKKLEGADVIFVPSQWGEPRKRHLEILGNALAVMNQCYVLIANSSKDTMASSSAIYAPMGGKVIDDASECIKGYIDTKQIKLMRNYLKLY